MQASDTFGPPPAHATRFRSDHLDEINAYIAAYDGTHRRAALGSGPLGYSMHAVRSGAVDLGWGQTRMRQKVRGVPRSAILHVPLRHRHVYTFGSRILEGRPDTAVLLAPGEEFTLYVEPEDCLVALRIPEVSLADEIAGRDPAHRVGGRDTREIPLAGGRLAALAALHRQLVDATRPSAGRGSVPLAAQLEAQLCSWLADQLLGTRPSSPTPVLAIQRLRKVEAWIEAHLADPITLGRLCAVAGVGDRALESAFRAHRGLTPMQFVTARRLAHVRRSLLDCSPGDSITELAHDAGFVHLGRFAVRYRAVYHESPSTTLRREVNRA